MADRLENIETKLGTIEGLLRTLLSESGIDAATAVNDDDDDDDDGDNATKHNGRASYGRTVPAARREVNGGVKTAVKTPAVTPISRGDQREKDVFGEMPRAPAMKEKASVPMSSGMGTSGVGQVTSYRVEGPIDHGTTVEDEGCGCQCVTS